MSFTPRSLYPSNPTTTRAQSTKLGVDPKGEKVVYANGRTVIIRNINEPSSAIAYSQHAQPVTVAKISPSGYYCASADAGGTVRVWDLAGTDQVLKAEVKVIAGRINDLEWDGESKRIIAVGEGRERYGHAFMFDSGSSVGEISGHSKPINAVAMRRERPFRAVTASDDNNLIFYHGVPYKYAKTISTHTRFVQDVAYARSGDYFASVGSDSKLFLYDGKTGDTIADLSAAAGADAHKGTIFAVDFSPDSKMILTSGADGTAKVWDVAAQKVVATYDFNGQSSDKVEDQQVGNVWLSAQQMLSLSFSGELNVLDLSKPGKEASKLYGPSKSIGAFAKAADAKTLLAGSYDGRVMAYDEAGVCKPVAGSRHTNAVTALSTSGNATYSAAMDDTVREIENGQFAASAIATTGQPKSLGASGTGHVFAATPSGIDVLSSGKKVTHINVSYTPSSIVTTRDGKVVAVGSEEAKVYLYDWDGSALKQVAVLENGRSTISALAFDREGTLLAAGESNGKIMVYDVPGRSLKFSQWVFHSARVSAIDWSADGTHAVSGSLDTHVYVWSTLKPMKNIPIKNAHAGGVTGVTWLDDATVASAGADACVKTFAITRHA